MEKTKIHVIFEYKFHCGKKASQSAQNINEVFGKDVASEHTVLRWLKKFCIDHCNLENEQRGRPVSNMDNHELKAVVENDTFQTTN